MANEVTIGLDKIQIFVLEADGTPGAEELKIGNTLIDSLTFTQEDGTTVDVNIEESDSPVFTRTIPGARSFTYQIPDPNFEGLADAWGDYNALTGFTEPTQSKVVECQFIFTPSIGRVITFNRVIVSFSIDGSLGKNNQLNLNVTGNVAKPVNDLPIVSYKEK